MPKRIRLGLTALTISAACVAAPHADAARLPPKLERQRQEPSAPATSALRLHWKKAFTERELLEFRPRELGGPTVETFSGDVALATRRGKIYLLDPLGREVWSMPLGAAPTTSPAVTEDEIFVGTTDGLLHAFDRFNGEPLWTHQLGGQVLGPPVATYDAVFVGTDHDAVHALDPQTGEPLWVYRRSTAPRLTVRGGTAVSIEDGRIFAGFSDGALVALGEEDGRILWQVNPAQGSYEKFSDADAAPLVLDGVVYTTVFNDGIYAYDAATGALRWRADGQGAHSLAAAGELILVGGAGRARALHAANGGEVWSTSLGGSYVVRPLVLGEVSLLAGPEGILVLATKTGKRLGRFFPGSGFSAPPAGSASEVYAFSDLGFFYKLSVVAGAD